jgi:hypothetical protein
MLFVTWGDDATVGTKTVATPTLRTLTTAEQSEKRPHTHSTGVPITLEELRGRATAEQAHSAG